MKNNRIHIFGASGSGVTTLGRTLSEYMNIPVFDFDDYYWEDTDPPFTCGRPKDKQLLMINKEIAGKENYIISGHYAHYAYELDEKLTLAIFIFTAPEVRIERLNKREKKAFGDRILPGGDMYKNSQAFFEWARGYDDSSVRSRTLEKHMERILYLSCPVVKLDGNKTVDELVEDLRSINLFL